ncbi:hypothetical protein [Streptomyces sp. NPDC047070]|uniref:hypothetical protein n=1 Tax=Streptomyces sp. NPDC047070 TaxID=3154923 RepID=UPI0034537BE2
MTGKAGGEGHIRPEHGTDVIDRGAESPSDASGPDASGPDSSESDAPESTSSESDSAGAAPIFVDPSGRRAGRMRRLGWLVAAGCVCSAATLGVAIADGNSTAPWLQIPGVLGDSFENRSLDEAPESQRPESGAPTADDPSSTAAGSPIRQPSNDTAPEAMGGSPSGEKGSTASADEPSAAGASSKAGNTGAAPADEEEAVAAQPGRTTSPDPAQEATTAPSPADSTAPDTSAEPSPTETSSGGLLDGIGDIVTGLFGK